MKKLLCAALAVLMLAGVAFAQTKKVQIEWMDYEPISPDELKLFEEIEKRANCEIKVNVVNNRDYRNVLATRLAGGDLPDIMFIEDVQPYLDGVLAGSYANISKYITSLKLDNVKNMIGRVEAQYGKMFTEKDGYYRIPQLQTKAYGWHIVYRKDWADALGLKYDGSIESWLKMARAMKNAHPGTTGVTGFGIWAPGTAIPSAFVGETAPTWNRPNLRTNAAGKWYAVETSDGFRDAMKFMKDMYSDGTLDAEIFSINDTTAKQKFVQGKAAMIFSNTGHEDSIDVAFREANPNGKLGVLENAPKGPKGFVRAGSAGYYKAFVVAKRSEDRVQAAMRVLNVLWSPEIVAMVKRTEGWKNGAGGIGLHSYANRAGVYGDYSKRQWMARDGLKFAEEEVVIQDPRYVEYATLVSQQYKPEVSSVMEEWITKFISGKADASKDADWKAYLTAVDKAGLPKLIDDITKKYNK